MSALSPPIRKLTAAAAVVIVSAGVAVTGGVAASASPAPRPVVQKFQTDHQLCYVAAVSGPGIKLPPPGSITLQNQFGSFKPTFQGSSPVQHCNPVEKILPDGHAFPVTNPGAHLLCWKISGDTTKQPPVVVSNQFGLAHLVLGQASMLCLPTWKSLTRPPNMKSSQPPGLSHYACYPVRAVASGGYKAPGLKLKDEFAARPVPARVTSFTPTQLCVPTTKIVATPTGKKVYPVVPGAMQLLCFGVSPTPRRTPVFDQDQFTGPGTPITIKKTLTLCVPSTQIISPHLYWTTLGEGTVMKASLDGTGVTTLVPYQDQFPQGVAVDSSHIYWAAFGLNAIYRANLNGTGVTTLVTGQDVPEGVAVDSSHIYWTDLHTGTIMKADLDGTGVTTLVTGQHSPVGVAVDSSHIYWTSWNTGTIMKANLNGTGVTTLVTGQDVPWGIAVDSSHIYWADDANDVVGSGTIMKANLDGTGVTTLVTGQDAPWWVAVDSSHIYWNAFGFNIATIMKASLNGTGVTALVPQADAVALAVGP